MPSSSTSFRALAQQTVDGNGGLRQLIQERTERLASGENKLISHDEFWDQVGDDFKEQFGVYPDEVEDE